MVDRDKIDQSSMVGDINHATQLAGRVPCFVRLNQQSDHLPFGFPN